MLSVSQMNQPVSLKMEGHGVDFFTCSHCSDQFKREDHLRRHELSHQSPKFKCLHEGCEKSFHRNDVLKRHQLVHRPGPAKRKRATRRKVSSRSNSRDDSPPSSQCSRISEYPMLKEDSGKYHLTHHTPTPWITIGYPLEQSRENLTGHSETVIPPWLWTHGIYSPASPGMVTTSPMLQCIQMCVDRARRTTLGRLPFVHSSTIDNPELPHEFQLSLAAVGARDLDGNHGFGSEYFCEAAQLLEQMNMPDKLRRLQCQVLLIDFAAWSDGEANRHWAMKEQQVAATTIQQLLDEPKRLLRSGWSKWLYEEELKRTALAFYSQSVHLAVLQDYPIPLSIRLLPLKFPCSDDLWHTRNELEWSRQLPLWESDREMTLMFPIAVHNFIGGTMGNAEPQYRALSLFGQHLLLCGLLEALEMSKKSPLNYASVEGWLSGSIDSFNLNEHFLHIFRCWNDICWQPWERYWVRGDLCRPRLESIMVLMYTRSKLTDMEASLKAQSLRELVEDATNCLWWGAKAGFDEVISTAASTVSPGCRIIGAERHHDILRWLERVSETNPAAASHDQFSANILGKLRDVVAVAMTKIPSPMFTPIMPAPGDLMGLRERIAELWSCIAPDAADAFA